MEKDRMEREHILFEEMSDYIFMEYRPKDFLSKASRINNHVTSCPVCKEMYVALMSIKDETEKMEAYEPIEQKLKTRLLGFLYMLNGNRSMKSIMGDYRSFQPWLSFTLKNRKELTPKSAGLFFHPKLVGIMNSVAEGQEITEAEIKSSLCDAEKNRVSIGPDGTLSLYFDQKKCPVGKRVILLPEDFDIRPRLSELKKYDDYLSHIRIEGMTPGEYTIFIESLN